MPSFSFVSYTTDISLFKIAPNLTQIAREFNFTDEERDVKIGGQIPIGFFIVGGSATVIVVS
jgi:hypothetical protein